MKNNVYSEFSDFYCEYENFDNQKKDDGMKEILEIMQRMDIVLQITCVGVIGILITILMK